MRILDVSPRAAFPPTVGSIVRTYNLLARLSGNHDVVEFAQTRWGHSERGEWLRKITLFPGYCAYEYAHPLACAVVEMSERSWVSAPVLSGLALSLTRPRILNRLIDRADVTLVEFPWQFEYCRSINPTGRIVLASHNVEALKFRDYARAMNVSLDSNRWVRLIEKMERRAVRRADLVLAVSSADKDAIVRRYDADPDNVIEVPNGVDTELYRPAGAEEKAAVKRALRLPEKPLAIFVGADVPPNRVGLQWLRRLARRAPDLTFVVVGTVAPEARTSGNLVATGLVTDHRPYLSAADVALCPIRFGGGTKIKLLEYLATGLPTLAFRESIHGTSLEPDEHVVVADENEDALLAAMRRVLGQPALGRRLSDRAREFMVRHHDWRTIAQTLEAALLDLNADRASA
jgi:glycosyltransferase involved in cell wall biosynthesis